MNNIRAKFAAADLTDQQARDMLSAALADALLIAASVERMRSGFAIGEGQARYNHPVYRA